MVYVKMLTKARGRELIICYYINNIVDVDISLHMFTTTAFGIINTLTVTGG